MVGAQPLPGAARIAGDYRLGLGGTQQDAAGRHPRPVRRAGDHPHQLSRAGPARGRGAGHLPDHHDHAVGAGVAGGARVLVLRRLLRLCDLRGRYRPVLGAGACPRIPQPGRIQTARRHTAADRPGRHRGWLGVQLRAGRSQWTARPGTVAQPAGLVPQVRTADGARGVRGRHRRRHGAPVPGGGRSGEAACLRHRPEQGLGRDPRGQPRGGRFGPGDRRGRVHGAHPWLPARHRGPRTGPDHGHGHGHTGTVARHRPGTDRSGDASGGRRPRR